MPPSPHLRSYFGDQVINRGFLVLPNLLLRHYKDLGISEETFVFTLHLLSIVWNYTDPPENLPDIARRMGKSVSMVRRYSHALHQAGLVVIRPRWKQGLQIGNDYDLSPLWDRLAALVTSYPASEDSGIVLGSPVEPSGTGADIPTDADMLVGDAKLHALPRAGAKMPAPGPAEMPGSGRAELEGPGHAKLRVLAPAEMPGLKGKEEDPESQDQQDAAAAAMALFAQIVSLVDARKLVLSYPACIPHAPRIAEEVANAAVENKGGLLVRLVERGWTPPAPGASRHKVATSQPETDAAMLAKFSRCPYCRGPIGDCDCAPAWLTQGSNVPAN